MQLTGEQHVPAPKAKVWAALNDPEILRASIPGCQELEKTSDTSFAAVIEVKIGPIGARFKGAVDLQDIKAPDGYTLVGSGNAGIVGTAKGSAKVSLTEQDGGTLVSYTVESEVGGRLAQLGGPVIDATAKQLAAKFFDKFSQAVTGTAPAAKTQASKSAKTATPTTPSTTQNAAPSGFPLAWILGLVVAALFGFLAGNGHHHDGWMGIAIGLLLFIIAGFAFEWGRRSASSQVTMDIETLRKLLDGKS